MENEQATQEFEEFCDFYAFSCPDKDEDSEKDNSKDWNEAKAKVLHLMEKGRITTTEGALIYTANYRENGVSKEATYTISSPSDAKAMTTMMDKPDSSKTIKRFISNCVEECKTDGSVDEIPTHVFKDITVIIRLITHSK